MTEHEKYEQVGRLAEEYSRVKGELNHLNEKVVRAGQAYTLISQNFQALKVTDGALHFFTPGRIVPKNFQDVLSGHELTEVFIARERLHAEVERLATRLKELAPHLL